MRICWVRTLRVVSRHKGETGSQTDNIVQGGSLWFWLLIKDVLAEAYDPANF